MAELLTSLDVVNQSFKKSLRGYDSAEVDEFLDHVAETLQSYNQKNKEMERELAAKTDSLAEYEKMKNVLHEALLMAQKSADERVSSAREQASRILEDARAEAQAIKSDAVQEAEGLRSGVEQIRNIRDLYAQEFRGMLAKFDNQLTQAMNSSKLAGAVESVLETAEEPEGETDAEEEAEKTADGAPTRSDLEAACGILGVDPKEIMGHKK